MAIKLGLFMMPNHPPTVSINDAHDFDIETIVVADQLGYQEVWVGVTGMIIKMRSAFYGQKMEIIVEI